jgi:hypothetical protein
MSLRRNYERSNETLVASFYRMRDNPTGDQDAKLRAAAQQVVIVVQQPTPTPTPLPLTHYSAYLGVDGRKTAWIN